MNIKHVDLTYKYSGQFKGINSFDYVQLAKHKSKNKDAQKILFVLDYMPSEDLKSGKILSGVTGQLFNNLFKVANKFYKEETKLKDCDWLVMSHSAFKTAKTSEDFKEAANKEFTRRLNYVITSYKPDIVVTMGPSPFRALNSKHVNEKAGGIFGHFYGVPIKTTVIHQGETHKFKHIPTLSLNTLVNTNRKGDEISLGGYVARNFVNVLHGELKYSIPKNPKFKAVLVDSMPKFKKMLTYIRNKKYVAIDTETTNLNRIKNKMLTIQFACNTDRAFVLPFYHKDSPFTVKELKLIKKKLRLFFEEKNNNKFHVYTNAVFDLNVMRENLGIRFFKNRLWDIFAGEFGLDENMKYLQGVAGQYYYSLLNLSMQYGCTAYYEAEFGKDKRKTIVTADLDAKLIEYCCLDVIVPLHIMLQQMRRGADCVYEKYESIVSEQISDMLHVFSTLEHNGCPTDIDYLFYLKSKQSPLRTSLDKLKDMMNQTKGVRAANKRLAKSAGVPSVGLLGKSDVNIFDLSKDEHKQMLFFDILKLKPLGKSKKGTGKIDKKFQEEYKDVPEISIFSKIGKLNKLMSSYVKAFINQWGSDEDMQHDRRIRPHFNFLDVVTGRTSAKKPSLHQIPSRSEEGKHIKRLFIAEKGRIIIKVDYAAHEVRCLSLDSYVYSELGMIKLEDFIYMPNRPLVYSFNHETGTVELKKASNHSVHTTDEDMYEIEYEGGTISVTGNHKIWSKTRNCYVRADSIEDGEELLVHYRDTKTVKVKSIRKITTPKYVCDVGIEDNHNLFVCDNPKDTPVLVHNCWSLITGDKDIAKVFKVGGDLRARFKIAPNPELGKRIDTEGDVHKINAAYFFGIDINEVTKQIRDAVKQVIFGLIYQQGFNGLAESTGQTITVITKLVKQFKARFPVGVAWFDDIKIFGRKNLFVESPVGRRRHLWGFILPKDAVNAEGAIARMERLSVNSPVQGLGSDYLINGSRRIECLKWDHYKKTGRYPDFYQANSVHDSISISCAVEDFWIAIDMIERGLTSEVAKVSKERHGVDFTVPLEIDFEIGPNERDVVAWDYSLDQLRTILKDTFTFQKEELDHPIDCKKVYKDIMTNQYDDMPEWAKKQCWNEKLNLPGMDTDIRAKDEKHKVIYKDKAA